MNQILDIKNKKPFLKKIFKFQFLISFIVILIMYVYILKENNLKNKELVISNTISTNAKLNEIFSSQEEAMYFGRIIIEKIDLDYYVYNLYSEEKLKVLPCKFSGGKLNQDGNICIMGHNYFDNRFFSNINKLNINDKIIIQDLNGNKYKYIVYNLYTINEKDINEVLKNDNNKKTITLCTCTVDKDTRFIVKAKRY